MDTYFIRHTEQLDINDATREKLWDEQRIAIHFPQDKQGELRKDQPDNASLNLADYPSTARRAMRPLTELAENGGYVCATYHGHSQCMLGYVKPNSCIELMRGMWGSVNGYDGREAILKTLRLTKVKLVNPCDFAVIRVGQPRQGTIMHWKRAGKVVENIIEGRRTLPVLGDLSTDQQETMCSEFLRTHAEQFNLPKLVHLLLPVGRTMWGADICGTTTSGMVFAQVTYSDFEHCGKKLDKLLRFQNGRQDGTRDALVLFCNCLEATTKGGVQIFPLALVYEAFVSTETGKSWLERSTSAIPSASTK